MKRILPCVVVCFLMLASCIKWEKGSVAQEDSLQLPVEEVLDSTTLDSLGLDSLSLDSLMRDSLGQDSL